MYLYVKVHMFLRLDSGSSWEIIYFLSQRKIFIDQLPSLVPATGEG